MAKNLRSAVGEHKLARLRFLSVEITPVYYRSGRPMSDENPFSVKEQPVSQNFPIGKKRHGCLTAWLIMMILANLLTAVGSALVAAGAVQEMKPNFPAWILWFVAFMALLNIVFVIALFGWKKWGFFGFAGSSIIAFGLNLYLGVAIGQAVAGLFGIVLLYLVMQIGGDRKGWTQLE